MTVDDTGKVYAWIPRGTDVIVRDNNIYKINRSG